MHKAVITCALTGVLTDPTTHSVPVTPEEMADAAQDAYNEGATIVHCHFRRQEPGMGRFPSWEPKVAKDIVDAIRDRVPGLVINMSTGVVGADISAPVACLQAVRPEMAALNAGTLNYLRTRRSGDWAWPPMIFDNDVDKIYSFLDVMDDLNVIPECECFDTGILRSVGLFQHNGKLKGEVHVSLVMGVASGMPAKASWLPLLIEELPDGAHWQTIGIGRQDVWDLHRKTAELGGHLRTGLEDTFYLPNGDRATTNGQLIGSMAKLCKEVGRDISSLEETRAFLNLPSVS